MGRKVSRRFQLGTEDVLDHRDIGKIVQIDTYTSRSVTQPANGELWWSSRSVTGRLTLITEDRGSVKYMEGDEPDLSSFDGYSGRLTFDNGSTVSFDEGMIAHVVVWED